MTMSTGGEGDRESARRYNEAARETAENLDEDDLKSSGDGPEPRDPLTPAEKAGRERAAETDPAVDRDYSEKSD